MATRTQKIKVGLFLIICLGLASISIVVIAGWYKNPGDPYWLEFEESVLGLYEGGMVEYLGVPVGKVSSIFVTANKKAHVELIIDPKKVRLQNGVEAQLVLYSLATGTMAISLTGGDPLAAPLEPGSQIPTKTSIITAISSRMESIIEDLASISESVSTGLAGIEEGDLTAIVEKVNTLLDRGNTFLADGSDLVEEISQTVTQVRGDAQKVIDQLYEVSKDARALTKNVNELVVATKDKVDELEVHQLQGQLDQVLQNITNVSKRLDTTLAQFDALSANTLHEVDNVEYTLRSTLHEVSDAFDSIRSLAEQLRQDPSALVRGKARVKEVPR